MVFIFVANVFVGSLAITIGGKVRGWVGLVGIIVQYTLLFTVGGIWGPLPNCSFNGPNPAM